MPLHHYPWCLGLRPRPCRISCRQNIYFCLICRLNRQKYHILITFGWAKFLFTTDLRLSFSLDRFLIPSVWQQAANFLSFHVTQAKFSLSRKGDSPPWSLLTSSLLGWTVSFGRNFLFPLTVPPSRIHPLSNSEKKGGTLVSHLSTYNLYPYGHRARLAKELHAWPCLCLPQDPPCRCKSWCWGHSQLQNLSRQNLSAQIDFFSKAKIA